MSNIIVCNDTQPSLCIPKIEKGIRQHEIIDVFKKLNFGIIDRIDMVSWKKNISDNNFIRVFIHFKSWNNSAEDIRKDLLNGGCYNIVYSFPWFWKIVASRLPKPN